MTITHLDFETTSQVDIKKCGGYKYANHASTRILMFGIAKDNEEVLMWRCDEPTSDESRQAKLLLYTAIRDRGLIYAHNCSFELAISHYRLKADLGIEPPKLEQWRDTMAMCNRAAINPGLKEAAQVLRLPYQKSAIGMKLIAIFSDQNKVVSLYHPTDKKAPVHKTFHPLGEQEIKWDWLTTVDGSKITLREAWELFIDYCRQDVRVEREIHKKLHKFELEGDILESFQFDLGMNFRGVPINRKALTHAAALVKQYKDHLEIRFKNLCGFISSQNAKVMAWLKERGYPKDSLAADTVELIVAGGCEGMTPEGVVVLKMRSLLSFAALGKIDAMLRSCCDDGYVRGTTQWHGARTLRATGRIMQVQNMKKATIKDSELAYEMICEESPLEDIASLWDSPLEVIASCIRHFIQPHEGQLLDVDFVGVEGRLAPWISGELELLDMLLAGVDPYKWIASEIAYAVPYEQITKEQRQVGKVLFLSCCFGTGGRGMQIALRDLHRVHKTLKECNSFVKKYRERFSKQTDLWKAIENAAKEAIQTGKASYVANGRVGFGTTVTAGMKYLVMKLPSGLKMYYPDPKVERVFKKYAKEEMLEDPWKAERKGYELDQISFYGKSDGPAGAGAGGWGRVTTWGSRLYENLIQRMGAELLYHGCIEAQKCGYDVFMQVHDQALAYANNPLEGFLKAFCSKQPWAKTFPLDAAGSVQPYYLKD